MSDLSTQLREYFDATAPPLDVEKVVGDEVWVPAMGKTPSGRRTAPSWAYGIAAFVVVLILGLALLLTDGSEDEVAQPTPTTVASVEPTTPPLSAELSGLLNGFLAARVAGEGAQQYLSVAEDGIPLLYATSSGARYERAEFEPVAGVEWPYGWIAFKVRLFAGDTVVEQLLFTPPADDGLALEYQPDGFGTEIAPTTEDGQPLARAYSYFDGELTLHAAHPWIIQDAGSYPTFFGRLIPEGQVAPTTDGGERGDWDELHLIADPVPAGHFAPMAADCPPDPGPADAEALAESLRSYRGLEATVPVVTSVGGAAALMVDVEIAAGTRIMVSADDAGNHCANALLYPVIDKYALGTQDQAKGERIRFYLIDMPEGSSMRTMAMVVVPESGFERAVEAAAPVVESIEFHTP